MAEPPTPSSSHQIPEQSSKKKSKGARDTRTYDEIFASVGAGENDRKKMKIVEPPNDVITTDLLLHQKEGLAWLIERENSCKLAPFWEGRFSGCYENLLMNSVTKKLPEPLHGGIFADDMGLGKTLTLLSLIAANRPGCVVPPFVDIGDDRVEKHSPKKDKVDVGCGDLGPKATLIVCPLTVLSTWKTQLEEHTRPESLNMHLYYGECRTKDVEELQRFDIVLTTYSTLATERKKWNSPIREIKWWRIILDEAHVLRNAASQQSQAVISLKGKRRWAVTGTPIQNGTVDLFSLMAFLEFEPFSIKNYWLGLVQNLLDQGSPSGLLRLQALLRIISLRRTKESLIDNRSSIGLPQKTIETCFVEFSAKERKRYEYVEAKAKAEVNKFIGDESAMTNYSVVLHNILQLRRICNCLDLCPLDITSLLTSSTLKDVSSNPELLTKMVSILREGEDFDCPICLFPLIEHTISSCAHMFCECCILEALQRKPQCPICRKPLSKSDLFSAPPQPSDDSNPASSSATVSSKVSTLLKLLVSSRDENPSIKSVIFSQFRKMLILLEQPLKEANFAILRLDGSMTDKRRSQVIEEFCDCGPGTPTVLLASLQAAGAGINLTAASRAYLLEPWYNAGVEEQAMNLLHRIGQKKEVKVMRLIVRNSIEERILELQQQRKNDFKRAAFGKKGGKELGPMLIGELRILMGL